MKKRDARHPKDRAGTPVPPNFDVLIEIRPEIGLLCTPMYRSGGFAAARLSVPPEIRAREEDGKIHVEKSAAPAKNLQSAQQGFRRQGGEGLQKVLIHLRGRVFTYAMDLSRSEPYVRAAASRSHRYYLPVWCGAQPLDAGCKRLGVPAQILDEPGQAEAW
jgi:hypothetical protein